MRLWAIALLAALSVPAFSQTSQSPVTATWYVSGRVMLEDGAAPLGGATVENVCNGVTYLTTSTDSQGQFSFRMGASGARLLQDSSASTIDPLASLTGGIGTPSTSSNTTNSDSSQQTGATEKQQPPPRSNYPRAAAERAMDNCELRVSLPGYWAEPASLRGRRPLDAAPIGAIVLRRVAAVEGQTVSVTTLAAPKNAAAAYEKGRKAAEQGKLDQAGTQFEKAVRLYPKFALAWTRLGEVQVRQNRPESAEHSFENAIQADPNYVQPFLDLAAIQMAQRQWANLTATTGQALKLDPVDYPQAYYMDAVGNFYARKFDAAEKSARQAEKLDRLRRWPQVRRILGQILAVRHQFADAAAQFREYLRLAPRAPDADEVRRLLARAEELGGGRP